jgi:endonuclease-3
LFFHERMQHLFDFGPRGDIAWIRGQLARSHGPVEPWTRRDPVSQMIRSILGSRTKDEVSERVFKSLHEAYPDWTVLAAAPEGAIFDIIADVQLAEKKVSDLKGALVTLLHRKGRLELEFLRPWEVSDAMAWLTAVHGVGPKVAAATLNFSTLDMPAMVVDTHVLRVLYQFGITGRRHDIRCAYDRVMSATPDWSAWRLTELHVLIKRLGQTVCPDGRPHCAACPLEPRCAKRPSPPRARHASPARQPPPDGNPVRRSRVQLPKQA